jgi:hypothetical protein
MRHRVPGMARMPARAGVAVLGWRAAMAARGEAAIMPYAKTSLRGEKRKLREQMRSAGLDYRQIATEFARVYKLRPRAAWREAYGWSLLEAAEKINAYRGSTGLDPGGLSGMTAPHLSEYENWPGYGGTPAGRKPSPYLLAVLSVIYDCRVSDLIDLADRKHLPQADLLVIDTYSQPPVPSLQQDVTSGEVTAAVSVPKDAGRRESLAIPDPVRSSLLGDIAEVVNRREFLFGMAASVGAGAVAGIMPPFKHVDPELIPYFQKQLEGHYHADMLLGPCALISTVTAQCNLIGQLIDNADEPTRQRMAAVGTSFATFAAWLYLDAGDIAAALHWHDAAQEMAHRSRDREAVACALVDRAMARTDQGKGAAVVDLCNGALMDAGHLSPELRVFALQQQAHGASLLGDRREADALLDAAGRLLDQVDVEAWGTACLRTPHYVEVQRATCYGRLGLAGEALGVWQQIMSAAPSTARRDVGVWVARQATLSASLREPEQAVELARHAVKVALETGSARVRRELEAAEATMEPWQADPVGQDFADVLAPISEGI